MARGPNDDANAIVRPPAQRPPQGPYAASTELRNVTILFADVVESTRAIVNLEPAEARRYLDQAVEVMVSCIRKFGGAVGHVQGDGLLAVFGTPTATEDHALRAGLAAIEITETIAALPPYPRVGRTRVRVGLHSGGASTRAERTESAVVFDAIGAVVHLASKIEHMAPAGRVAASAATIRLMRGFVRSKPIGALALDGEEPPLQVEELLEVSPDYRLEHYFSRRRLSPLVGREHELRVLAPTAKTGSERLSVIGLLGDAGVGKSRLCYEAQALAERAGYRVAELRGVSLNRATAFAPVIPFLSGLLIGGDAQMGGEFRPQLEDLGLQDREAEAVAGLFRVNRHDGASTMPADARKRAIVSGVAKAVSAMALRRPLLLIVEDVHDMDDETCACVQTIATTIEGERLRIIATARPEGAERLGFLSGRVLTLEALSRRDCKRLAEHVLHETDIGVRTSLAGVIDNILDRANGNPFVIEELLRSLTSARARGIGGVPISLEILIRSRVDKLSPPAQQLLHCASVIGMRFSASVLRRVAGYKPKAFEAALRELVEERFLVADAGLWVEFVHQITRDACNEGIVRDVRVHLHEAVLAAAEADQERLTFSYEALADHAFRAGKPGRALDFLWEACRDSIAHSAIRSVAELRRRAMSICGEMGEAGEVRAMHFDLLTFDAIQQLGMSQELVGSLEAALRVAEQAGVPRQLCHVSTHLASIYWILGRYEPAHKLARRALVMAREAKNLPLVVYAQWVLSCIQFKRGFIRESVELGQELRQTLSGELETARFGAVVVMSVMSNAFLCWFLSDLGRFEEAGAAARDAIRVADATEQPYSQLLAYSGAGYRLMRMGRFEDACEHLAKADNICRSNSFLALDAIVSGWYAAALLGRGDDEEARRVVMRAIELDLGRYCCVPASYYIHGAYARLQAREGRRREALQAAEQAVGFAWSTRDPVHYAYACAMRADVKALLNIDKSGRRRNLLWALRRARRLGMTKLQAQCEQALSRL